MTKINLQELISIISKQTNLPEKRFNLNSRSDEFERWDSLAQINIIIEIEKKIRKKINVSMISELNSIKSILNYLNN